MFSMSIHNVACVVSKSVQQIADQPNYRRYTRPLQITDSSGEVIELLLFADDPGALVIRGAEMPTDAEIDDMAAQHEPETVDGAPVGGEG